MVISRRNCAGTAKKCTKKRDARAALLFFSLNLLLFRRSPSRRRRSFVRSLIKRTRLRTDLRLRYDDLLKNQIVEVAARSRTSRPITERGEHVISVLFRFYLQLPQTGMVFARL